MDNKAARKRLTALPYRLPWFLFFPTSIAFLLLTTLAWWTTVNADGTDLLPSPSVIITRAEREMFGTETFDVRLFLEDDLMRHIFRFSLYLGGMPTIRFIWYLAWLLHCLEVGIAVRVCVACRAGPLVFGCYVLLTALGGVTQLIPLLAARDDYMAAQAAQKDKDAGMTTREKNKGQDNNGNSSRKKK